VNHGFIDLDLHLHKYFINCKLNCKRSLILRKKNIEPTLHTNPPNSTRAPSKSTIGDIALTLLSGVIYRTRPMLYPVQLFIEENIVYSKIKKT
jgi:hypothetical protein